MLSRVIGVTLLLLIPFLVIAQVDLNQGLVAYYPFNGNANDASGNGNNPVFNNATLTSDYYGNLNSAYHFNGVDNYMEIANSVLLNPTTISICAWIKPTGFYYGPCHGNSVIMKGNADHQAGNYMIRFDDALYTGTNCDGGLPDTTHQTYYGIGTGLSPVQDTPYAQKNIWRSVVYTYDGSHAKLYIDCNLILDSEQPGLSFSNADDLFFGRLNDAQFPYWLNGDLDEVRIYSRALNSDEVKAYSFSCADKEPCSNWLETADIDPGVQIGDLDIPGDKITVEALFNRTDNYDPTFYGGDIVSKHTSPADVNYLLRPTRAEITTTTGWHGTPDVCNFELNKTYHVAMVYDGNTLKFYRNGFLMSQISCTGNLILNDWLTRIGSTAAPPDQNPSDFHGNINEVRIWNVVRTQGEIRANMSQSLPNPSTQNGLLAYYTFDNLKNKQGNSQWDGSLLNNASINQINPNCAFVADSCKTQCNLKVNAGKNASVCNGSSIQLKATGATTYNWNTSAVLSDTTIADPIASPLTTTEFIVTGYNSTGSCSDKDTVKISVLPLPVFTLNNDTSICNGSHVNLHANGNNDYHYHWTPPNSLSDTSVSNPVANPADTIKYFVIATDSNNCRSTDSVQINVVPKPVVATINDTSICLGSTILLSTNVTNANKFSWNPSSYLNSSSIQSPQASPVSSILYTINASNSLCSSKDSVQVTVLSLPNIFAGNDTIICSEGAARLHAAGAVNYNWRPGKTLSDSTVANPVAFPSLTTTYYVVGKDENNCINKDSVTVTKQEDPVFSVNPEDSSICSGHTISLTASGGNTYSWSPSQSVTDPSAAKTSANPLATTNYTVSIYDSTCRTSATLNSIITVKLSPDITITKSNDIDCSNLKAQLNVKGGTSYNWTPATYIDNTQIANPVVNPPSDTKYSVAVTGENGCISQGSVLVKSTIGNMGFYVASAFTPNSDGLNDCFGVSYWGVPASFDMMVYDKWGVPVYHSKNISECWDGTYKGKKQASGTYVYMITATSVCGEDKVFRKGTVVLIR